MSGQNYSLWSLLKHGLRQHRTCGNPRGERVKALTARFLIYA